jgi:hypothetical protein
MHGGIDWEKKKNPLIAVECSFVITHSAAVRVTGAKMADGVEGVSRLEEKAGKRTFLVSIMRQLSTEDTQPYV